jgi:hypothetical protein
MGILDGGLQSIFGAAFGGIYSDGTLYVIERVENEDGGFTPYERRKAIKGQVDACTEAMRQQAGYTERDARLMVLQIDQHACPVARPTTDAQITLGGTRWAVGSVEADPANTHWIIRATPA